MSTPFTFCLKRWIESSLVDLRAKFIPGKIYALADQPVHKNLKLLGPSGPVMGLQNDLSMQLPQDTHVCKQSQQETSFLCLASSRYNSLGGGCHPASMGKSRFLCLNPLLHSKDEIGQDSDLLLKKDSSGSKVATGRVVYRCSLAIAKQRELLRLLKLLGQPICGPVV